MVSQVLWANAAPAIDRPAPPSGRQLGICYVAAASGERQLGNALDDLRALGHEVLAVAVDTATLGWTGDIVSLCAIDTMPALTEAVANPAGFAAALSFAQRQKAMPRRALLRAGARAAFLARLHGCAHLHASSGGAAASVAICAARIASATVLGISCSFKSRKMLNPCAANSSTTRCPAARYSSSPTFIHWQTPCNCAANSSALVRLGWSRATISRSAGCSRGEGVVSGTGRLESEGSLIQTQFTPEKVLGTLSDTQF